MLTGALPPTITLRIPPVSRSAKISLSPRIRKSPFFEATERAGALAYTVYNKTYMPIGYGDPEAEFWKIVRDVTLWDVAGQRVVEIAGPDAFTFTDRMTPRDLSKCQVGQCKYVLITNPDGGILNDPVLLRLAEDRFWLSRADGDILSWAQGLAVNSGLDVDIREPQTATLQLQGPKSAAVAEALFGPEVAAMRYYDFIETSLCGAPVLLARTGWSAERGYEIYLRDTTRGVEVWDAVMAAGAPHGIVPAAPSRIRRIEGAILDFSVDMDEGTNPFEIGLERLVDLDGDRDFIGKAALQQVARDGITRRLVGVELDGTPVAYNEQPWPVRADGQMAGQVTSCVYSLRLERNIGYAMLRLDAADLGHELQVETPDGARPAKVVEMPFVDPRKALARA